MIQKEGYKLIMMFIILKVGLIPLTIVGNGDYKGVWLPVVYPLGFKVFLIIILMLIKLFIRSINILEQLNN